MPAKFLLTKFCLSSCRTAFMTDTSFSSGTNLGSIFSTKAVWSPPHAADVTELRHGIWLTKPTNLCVARHAAASRPQLKHVIELKYVIWRLNHLTCVERIQLVYPLAHYRGLHVKLPDFRQELLRFCFCVSCQRFDFLHLEMSSQVSDMKCFSSVYIGELVARAFTLISICSTLPVKCMYCTVISCSRLSCSGVPL